MIKQNKKKPQAFDRNAKMELLPVSVPIPQNCYFVPTLLERRGRFVRFRKLKQKVNNNKY